MAIRYVAKTKKDTKTLEILGLCNANEDWKSVTKDQAIKDIEGNTHTYKVSWAATATVPAKVTEVRVVTPSVGAKYLRTDWDTTTRNNLHDLPDC